MLDFVALPREGAGMVGLKDAGAGIGGSAPPEGLRCLAFSSRTRPISRRCSRWRLNTAALTVVAVGNGEAAVRRMPDLIRIWCWPISSCPCATAMRCASSSRRIERFSHVPVILLVGAFDPLDEKEARRVGADGVLKKPFVPPIR